MVSLFQYSFGLVCAILLMTPFNMIRSTEARQLQVQRKAFQFPEINFGALLQKLNLMSSTGSSSEDRIDLFGNGNLVFYPNGLFISTQLSIGKDVLSEITSCGGNLLDKLGIKNVVNSIAQIGGEFDDKTVGTNIASSSAMVFIYDNGVFIKYSINLNQIGQKLAAYIQKLPQLYTKLVNLPQCLTS